nr:phage major capsid protein [Streptosporangium sp. 'caverna']
MSLADSAGGFLVPLTLDPTVLLTSSGSINPLRRISRVVQTATDKWQGVTSAGVTAEWLVEANEAVDATPTVAGPDIPVNKGSAWVPYSYEVGTDAVGFARELQRLLLDAADQLMATAYTIGDGIGKPTGIVTALAGTASEINGTGSEAIVAADAFALQNALPPRFSARAQWAANLSTINALRQLETSNGALKFPELANGQLLGRTMNENSNMDGVITPAATASNYAMIYGDFQNFVIVDRIGTTIELIPNLMGENGRPTGERGLFMWFRTGSDVVVDNAFRMLDVPTTA